MIDGMRTFAEDPGTVLGTDDGADDDPGGEPAGGVDPGGEPAGGHCGEFPAGGR